MEEYGRREERGEWYCRMDTVNAGFDWKGMDLVRIFRIMSCVRYSLRKNCCPHSVGTWQLCVFFAVSWNITELFR